MPKRLPETVPEKPPTPYVASKRGRAPSGPSGAPDTRSNILRQSKRGLEKRIAVWVPRELYDRVDEVSVSEGRKKGAIVEEALELWFGGGKGSRRRRK